MAGKFSIEAIFKGNDQVSKVISGIEGKSKGLSKQLKELGEINSKIVSGFADIAKKAAIVGAVVGGVMGMALFDVMKTSNEVADGQARLATVMTTTAGFSEGASDRMKAAAIGWSKVHKTTAVDFEKGAYMMVSAGLNEEQALAGVRTASLVAAATFGDANEAAKVLATQYNVLGDKTKPVAAEMARLGDVMTRTQQVFQLENLDQLTEGLKYGTPIAKMFGQSLESLNVVMGMLNGAGITGTSAGTAYTAMLEKMIPASKKLGFAVAHAKDGTIDFGGTLTNIHKKFGDFSKASDAVKESIIEAFGRRGLVGVALLSDKAGEYAGNLAKINDNANAAANAAAIMESRGSGPLGILENKAIALKVALGDALQPATAPFVERIGKVVDSLSAWVDKNHELIATRVQDFLQKVADDLPVIVMWADRLGRAVLVIGSFMLAVKMATGAIALFNFIAAANPWVLLAIALVVLTALFVALWPEIKKHKEIIEAVAYVAGILAVALKGQALWTGIVTAFTTIATGATNLYAGALKAGAIASGIMDAGLAPLLITLLAIGAAVAGAYMAFKAFTDLLSVSGGWDGLKAGMDSLSNGDGLFAGIDAYQNAQAKAGNPASKATEPAASSPDLMALMQSLLAKGPASTPAPVTDPAVAAQLKQLSDQMSVASPNASMPGMPTISGMPPGQDPQAMIAALMAQQSTLPGATSANGKAPAQSAKETGESLAAAMAPALTDALRKGKGEITVTVKGGTGTVDRQPESGFELNMSPSGGF